MDEIEALARQVIAQRITVPGAQAKMSLKLQKETKAHYKLTLIGVLGDYILKPATTTWPHMPELEDMTMHLAGIFSLATVPHCLIRHSSGEYAYITKRIDRKKGGGKIHMEDLCQLCERLTEDKYKGSMEQIGKIIATYSSNPGFDLLSLYEAAVFSFLSGNADMHLKNFSLIYYSPDTMVLSPFYDLLATRLLISEKEDNEEMALSLNGKKRKLAIKDFERFGVNLGLNQRQIDNVFVKFKNRLPRALQFLRQGFLPSSMADAFEALMVQRAVVLNF